MYSLEGCKRSQVELLQHNFEYILCLKLLSSWYRLHTTLITSPIAATGNTLRGGGGCSLVASYNREV